MVNGVGRTAYFKKAKAIGLSKELRIAILYSGLVDKWTQPALTRSKKERYLHPLPNTPDIRSMKMDRRVPELT